MNGRRKIEHQSRELERLRDENKELQSELKVANKELDRKDNAIAELKQKNTDLLAQIDDAYASMRDGLKRLNDARAFYMEAAQSARKIEHDYKELIAQLGIELKHTVKGGV